MRGDFKDTLIAVIGDSYQCYGKPGKIADGGQLIVAGGGLGARDLLRDVPSLLEAADYVMVCLADQITQKFLYDVRPDTIDLSSFYSETQDRNATYIQMSEMMLAPVRNGKSVLSIFYGHPGLFAAATHRAIGIARHEGISAHMRPGVSALDYAIADLGFDPAFPGMANFEATDLLMRCRPLDPTIHNIIWQIGMVGESGYSASGFQNKGLSQLKRHLLNYYNEEFNVTNYIASRFAGAKPTIEVFPIMCIDREDVSRHITASSTLYIPPFIERPYNLDACIELGWIKPWQYLPDPMAYKADTSYSDINNIYISQSASDLMPRIKNPSNDNVILKIINKIAFDANFRRYYSEKPREAIASLGYILNDAALEDLASEKISRFSNALGKAD